MTPKYRIEQETKGSIACYDRSYKVSIIEGLLKGTQVLFQGFVSGCGIQIVGQLTYGPLVKIGTLKDGKHKEAVDEFREFLISFGRDNSPNHTGAGAILATLGSTFKSRWHDLYLEIGFVEIDSYQNLAHPWESEKDIQTLYSFHVPREKRSK